MDYKTIYSDALKIASKWIDKKNCKSQFRSPWIRVDSDGKTYIQATDACKMISISVDNVGLKPGFYTVDGKEAGSSYPDFQSRLWLDKDDPKTYKSPESITPLEVSSIKAIFEAALKIKGENMPVANFENGTVWPKCKNWSDGPSINVYFPYPNDYKINANFFKDILAAFPDGFTTWTAEPSEASNKLAFFESGKIKAIVCPFRKNA